MYTESVILHVLIMKHINSLSVKGTFLCSRENHEIHVALNR